MCIISLKNYEVIFEIDGKREEIKNLEAKTNVQGFWDDNDQAQGVLKQITLRKTWVDQWENQHQQIEDLDVLLELLNEDAESGLETEIVDQLANIEKNLDDIEFRRMFREDIDIKNAIITIHPGAVEPNHKIGRKCLCACTSGFVNKLALKQRQWIFR